MTPWLQDTDVTLYHGDALEVLRELPDGSVHMCATSPPFYGLRDYGTGKWEGGNDELVPDCDHRAPPQGGPVSGPLAGTGHRERGKDAGYGAFCGKCGARRVDRQIGLEDTPDEWVASLVAVFAEVRRVLRDDGTCWIELGDSYNANQGSGFNTNAREGHRNSKTEVDLATGRRPVTGIKPKDLLGQPWLLAFALRADGWYLRSEIIWARPNPMPESVTDRPTKSHSTVFLLSKRPTYHFDQDAIREAYAGLPEVRQGRVGAYQNRAMNGVGDGTTPTRVLSTAPPQAETLDGSDGEAPRGPDGRRVTAVAGGVNSEQHRDGERWPNPSGANARTVWTIATEPTPFAHFATWPRKLVARMILAGTSEKGCCPECGAPWVRETERTPMVIDRSERTHEKGRTRSSGTVIEHPTSRTLGWSPTCGHDHAPAPCTVLDPFAGSATTCLVARNHGRRSIGIELSEPYLEIAADRLKQLSLLAELA